MANSIPRMWPRLKEKAVAFLSPAFISGIAMEMGLKWKNTPLALPNLVAWFARQILGGNLSMPELTRQAGSLFTPEAYCTARMKLPIEILRKLLLWICTLGLGDSPLSRRWKGHRLWHMDGTGISMPDTSVLQKQFGQPGMQKPGCGFPVAHVLCLFDADSGMVRDAIVSPLRTHDLKDAAKLHPCLEKGDILIADSAFESFTHLAVLQKYGIHAIFPAHHWRDIDFRQKRRRKTRNKRHAVRRRQKRAVYDREVIRKCGPCDWIIRWRKPTNPPKWISREKYDELPETIVMRELRRWVVFPDGCRIRITLVTTLTDEKQYPAEELVQVLKARWQVETNLRHLKTTMKMEILHSKTVAGVEKELWMYLIVYNVVRLIMLQAGMQQHLPPDRISFADALYWVRHGDLCKPLPELQVVPYRPYRIEPRVVKRRNDRYKRMTKQRRVLRKALMRNRVIR